MQDKRVTFPGVVVPLALLLPQLAITFVFFVWPSLRSLQGSLFEQDAFGLSERFVGFGNFALIVWPYAIAPAIAGVLWWFLFNPTIGVLPRLLAPLGVVWNHFLNGNQALLLVIIASAWKQVSYNFLFFLAGLQTIPPSLLEAAEIDGAGAFARFRAIVFPLLMPT